VRGLLRRDALVLCICVTLAGCSHRGGTQAADSGGGDGETQAIGGVWNGTDAAGRTIVGLVNEAGEFNLISDDGTQYAGTASSNGDAITAKAERLTRFGASKGSDAEAASLTGKVQQRQSMTLNIAPAAGAQPFPSDSMSLEFNSIYNSPSSLAMVAGDYTDSASGNAITVTGGGGFFWHESNNSCLANGAVSVIDPRYNVYEFQFSYSACAGADAQLNGVQFTGLGTLDTSEQPAQVTIGMTGQAGSHGYAIDMKLSRLPPRSPI
jgi:hypothetical protein